MMYTTKLQAEWVKLLEKEDKKISGCVHDGRVYVSPDGVIAYAIPQCNFYLDMEKIKWLNLHRTFPNVDACYPLTFKEKRIYIHRDKEMMVQVFTDDTGAEHKLDNKLMRPFEKLDCKLWVAHRNEKCAVLITQNNIPVALVMPVVPR